MIYTDGNIPHQHIEYYIHHNNMLLRNGLGTVIYVESLNYSK